MLCDQVLRNFKINSCSTIVIYVTDIGTIILSITISVLKFTTFIVSHNHYNNYFQYEKRNRRHIQTAKRYDKKTQRPPVSTKEAAQHHKSMTCKVMLPC